MSHEGPKPSYTDRAKTVVTTVAQTLNNHRGKVVAVTAAAYTLGDIALQQTLPPLVRLPLIGLFGTLISLPISGTVLGASELAEQQLTKGKKRTVEEAELKDAADLQKDIVTKKNDDVPAEDSVEPEHPASNPVTLEQNPSFTPSAEVSVKRRKIKEEETNTAPQAIAVKVENAEQMEIAVVEEAVKERKIVKAKRTPKK